MRGVALASRLVPMRYPMLDRALRLATRLHAGQEREGVDPLPYLTHPVEVLLLLRYRGGETDEEILCAAALHDTVEESGADLEEIARETSKRTAAMVEELTRREPTKEERRGLDKEAIWRLRSAWLLEEIRAMSPEAQKVKLADRLANLREGKRTKSGPKWDRYAGQTESILRIVPRERNPGLWDALRRELDEGVENGGENV